MNLVTLQFETTENFDQNLTTLLNHIEQSQANSIIVAPELCLNGYAYDKLDKAVNISSQAIEELKSLSDNRTIITTLTTRENQRYYNTLHLFHHGRIVHTQSKHKLFVLNDERKYFTSGELKDIKTVDIGGIKIASLICFELRFIELWQQIQGADIVCVPAMWGALRKENFETLTQALAVANQCYVMASGSSNQEMAKGSGIISPFGIANRDDTQEVVEQLYDPQEIKKMRHYLNVGIPC